jgi:hypothetical protein
MSFHFHTTCVNSTGPAIREMVEQARDITYRTMMKHCPGLIDLAVQLGYERHPAQGLTLKNDWHVSYHRSRYQGRPCYYFRWSGIEHIFLEAA